MKTNHTPGPWTPGKTISGGWGIWATPLKYNILDGSAPAPINAEANAHLAAAAPDLLTALQFAEEYLSSPAFVALHGDTASRKARAAITKATNPQ